MLSCRIPTTPAIFHSLSKLPHSEGISTHQPIPRVLKLNKANYYLDGAEGRYRPHP